LLEAPFTHHARCPPSICWVEISGGRRSIRTTRFRRWLEAVGGTKCKVTLGQPEFTDQKSFPPTGLCFTPALDASTRVASLAARRLRRMPQRHRGQDRRVRVSLPALGAVLAMLLLGNALFAILPSHTVRPRSSLPVGALQGEQCRHPTGRERMITPTLQTLQYPILLRCLGSAFGFPNPRSCASVLMSTRP
jgi:hypothetical protein